MRPGRMLSWNGESRQQTAGEAERCCAVLCCAVLCCAVLCEKGGRRSRRRTAEEYGVEAVSVRGEHLVCSVGQCMHQSSAITPECDGAAICNQSQALRTSTCKHDARMEAIGRRHAHALHACTCITAQTKSDTRAPTLNKCTTSHGCACAHTSMCA